MAVGERLLNGAAHLRLAINGEEVLPHALVAGGEQPFGRVVDAQHRAGLIQQHQALLHAADDLAELVLFLAQNAHLPVDFLPLAVDAPQQRRQLLVGVGVVQRVLQIQPVQRLDNPLAQPFGQPRGQQQRRQRHGQNGLEHAQRHQSRRRAADGDAQHRAVVHAPGVVDRLFRQRGGIARGMALALFQRLPNLRALGVVLHLARVGLSVAQHRAVGGDPREAVAVGAKLGQIVKPAVLHADGGEAQLVAQLVFLNAAEVIVHAAQNDRQAAQQDDCGDEKGVSKNLIAHGICPPADSPRSARS